MRLSTPAVSLALYTLTACAVDVPDPERINLLSERYAPTLHVDAAEIPMPGPAFGRGFLTGEDSYKNGDFVWCGAEPAQLVVTFVGGRPRALELEAKALIALDEPPIRVAVSLDGRPVAELDGTFGWQPHRIDVPAELSVTGVHRFELTFARTHTPAEIIPGNQDDRELSVSFRGLRFARASPPPATPKSERGAPLRLPEGSAASWTLMLPHHPLLDSDLEGATLAMQRDGSSPRPLTADDLARHGGELVRLWLEGPGEARALAIHSAAPPPPARATPRRSVAVVAGRVDGGQRLRRCSTDSDRARCCALSGVEAAAFGYGATPLFDVVSGDAEVVLAALDSGPTLVWWDVGFRDAGEAAAWLEAKRDVVTVELGADEEPTWLLARFPGEHGTVLGGRDVDLGPTVLALAGRDAPPRLDGEDLASLAAPPGEYLIRPLTITWTRDGRAVAVNSVGETVVVLGFPARDAWSIAESFAKQEAGRRHLDLAWLGP